MLTGPGVGHDADHRFLHCPWQIREMQDSRSAKLIDTQGLHDRASRDLMVIA
jgi:hypothetical protein